MEKIKKITILTRDTYFAQDENGDVWLVQKTPYKEIPVVRLDMPFAEPCRNGG